MGSKEQGEENSRKSGVENLVRGPLTLEKKILNGSLTLGGGGGEKAIQRKIR